MTGQPGISYYDIGNLDLMLALKTSAGWRRETLEGARSEAGLVTSLAFDQQGRAHIAHFERTQGALLHTFFDPR